MKYLARIDVIPVVFFSFHIFIIIISPSDPSIMGQFGFFSALVLLSTILLPVGCLLAVLSLLRGAGSKVIATIGLVACALPTVMLAVQILS